MNDIDNTGLRNNRRKKFHKTHTEDKNNPLHSTNIDDV